MSILSTKTAIDAGLLVFPPGGSSFPARQNRPLPFLIDSRGAGTNLALRKLIVDELTAKLSNVTDFDVIAAIAKAGTIWAAWLAWVANSPYATVHIGGPRSSGLQRAVEGDINCKRVLLIDNWIRSGASMVKAVDVVTQAGATPIGALTIVTDGVADLEIPLNAVWHIDELLATAGVTMAGAQQS